MTISVPDGITFYLGNPVQSSVPFLAQELEYSATDFDELEQSQCRPLPLLYRQMPLEKFEGISSLC